jgi:GNAT superfamily N-acetyltransferase
LIIFEPITEVSIDLALEIVNSNSSYNILENGKPSRSIEEVTSEFLNQATDSFIIKLKNKHIGIIDFLKNNPKDNYPWIGLLMIHGDYHSLGYGKKVYVSFEEKLKLQKFNNVRIGVLQKNSSAREFWISLGFEFYGNSGWKGKIVDCYEKQLT